MKIKNIITRSLIIGAVFFAGSCNDYLDINVDPNSVSDAPIEQLLTSVTTNVGFTGGSDLNRYAGLIVQQFSGQGSGATTQPQDYERYNIAGSDVNNLWNSMYSTTLSDIELIIQKANDPAVLSPHYAGVAKIMKAYTYQLLVDTWGKVPYSEAIKFTDNLRPKFDDGAAVYDEIIKLLDDGIKDINTASSVKSPGANSTIFTGGWAAAKPKWERTANTLKMRLYLHYSKLDKAKMVAGINGLASSAVMASNADNFEMPFFNATRQQNPMHQFELDRANQLFPNHTLVDMMNTKADPRRARYFTPFPFTYDRANAKYLGAKGGDAASFKYSRFHIYMRGDTTKAAAPINADGSINNTSYTYSGTAPIRMLTFAEYNFIRAEAAVLGATGDAQTFFQAGIRASMQSAGVATAAIDAYIAANGSLTGTESEKVKKIIEEKFVASYGVVLEPWTDWRRTGFPTLTPPPNALTPNVPRSLFYPQSEIDLNSNAPTQKANLEERVFWDK
jgi:Starch-binding associating with outer membrane